MGPERLLEHNNLAMREGTMPQKTPRRRLQAEGLVGGRNQKQRCGFTVVLVSHPVNWPQNNQNKADAR